MCWVCVHNKPDLIVETCISYFLWVVNKVAVSAGVSPRLRPLWCPPGDRRVWLRRALLGLCRDGPGPAGFPIPAALWMVSPLPSARWGISTHVVNWFHADIQDARCLCVCQRLHKHAHICWASLSVMLTLWHPLFSFKMSLWEADGWATWVFVCVWACLSGAALRSPSKIRSISCFWESVGWAEAGLRLLTEAYATFHLITVWSSCLFGLLTSWAL